MLLHVPDGQAESLQEALIEVYSEAKKHGIGIITMNHPGNFDGWEETVEPIRREPEPRHLNDFLATVFEPTQRKTLLQWFR
ncbi:MAG: hypothetical protein IPI57_14995 [Candidatus Competibacteraceae bacterium]|nr:hypothetical protein [Candidatus Competibacteraceae bacterium]